MQPDISVVIPTYNRQASLQGAIESCFEGNGDLAIEVVVVDDGSTDGTQKWMESLEDRQVRYVYQENQGAPAARNHGKEVARGRYIKFLDDDDRLTLGALTHEMDVFQHTGASVTYGGIKVQKSDEENYRFLPSERHDLISGLMRGSVWSHPLALTYHQEAVQTIQWDPSLDYNQDKDFAIRVASQDIDTAEVGEIVGMFNDHEGERITTAVKKEAPKVERFERQISFILKGIDRLREHDCLKPYHRRAAAEGMWQWAYMAAPYDLGVLKSMFDRIKEIDPDFLPSRRWKILHFLDRIGSPAFTETLLWPVRRLRV